MYLPLKGKRVALIGTFSVYHYEVQDLITQAGGIITEYIGNDTSLVVAGEGGSQSKRNYAHNYKIPVIDEAGLETILRDAMGVRAAVEESLLAAVINDDYGTW